MDYWPRMASGSSGLLHGTPAELWVACRRKYAQRILDPSRGSYGNRRSPYRRMPTAGRPTLTTRRTPSESRRSQTSRQRPSEGQSPRRTQGRRRPFARRYHDAWSVSPFPSARWMRRDACEGLGSLDRRPRECFLLVLLDDDFARSSRDRSPTPSASLRRPATGHTSVRD